MTQVLRDKGINQFCIDSDFIKKEIEAKIEE